LAVCPDIILADRGSLDLQSTPGVGKKVTVHFPAERIIENLDTGPVGSGARIADK
jgi:hypothetical protein